MADYISAAVLTTLAFQAVIYGAKVLAFGSWYERHTHPEAASKIVLLPTPLDSIALALHRKVQHNLENHLTV